MSKIKYIILGTIATQWIDRSLAQVNPANDIWQTYNANGARNPEFSGADAGMSGGNNAIGLINSIMKYLFSFMGIAAVVYAVYGGFKILKAGEDSGEIDNARKIIMHAIVGIVVIIFAYTIVNFVLKGIISIGNQGNV